MSLNSRLRSVEALASKSDRFSRDDPIIPYEVTAELFDRISHNLSFAYGPPPKKQKMLKQFTEAQVEDVWRRHYSCWRNGRLVNPPLEHIKRIDRLSRMTIEDWYMAHLAHILQFPHRIVFDLNEFSLGHLASTISQLSYIDYSPNSVLKRPGRFD